MSTAPKMLTIHEALSSLYQRYGSRTPSYQVLRDRIASGRTPFIKQGRYWVVAQDDLHRVAVALDLTRR